MTTCTPLYQLPYQACADRPCDFDDVACDFTDAVNALLSGFDSSMARTASAIPMARVRTQVPGFFPAVDWTIVSADTDNLIDITVDQTVLTTSRDGFWAFNLKASQTDSGDDLPVHWAVIHNGVSVGFSTNWTTTTNVMNTFAPGADQQLPSQPHTWVASSSSSGGSLGTEVDMVMYWHADPGVAP